MSPVLQLCNPFQRTPSPHLLLKKKDGTRKQSCGSRRTLRENIMDSFVSTAVPPVGVFHWDRDVRQSFQTRLGSVLIGCSVGWFFRLRDTLEGRDTAKQKHQSSQWRSSAHSKHNTDLIFFCVCLCFNGTLKWTTTILNFATRKTQY